MTDKNPNAVALGKLSKGKHKRFSEDELLKRSIRLAKAREVLRMKRTLGK